MCFSGVQRDTSGEDGDSFSELVFSEFLEAIARYEPLALIRCRLPCSEVICALRCVCCVRTVWASRSGKTKICPWQGKSLVHFEQQRPCIPT